MDLTEQIRTLVLAWPGVSEAEHEMGGVEFRVGRRELGHYHDDLQLADLAFPVSVREQLVQAGKAQPSPHLPEDRLGQLPGPRRGGRAERGRALPSGLRARHRRPGAGGAPVDRGVGRPGVGRGSSLTVPPGAFYQWSDGAGDARRRRHRRAVRSDAPLTAPGRHRNTDCG